MDSTVMWVDNHGTARTLAAVDESFNSENFDPGRAQYQAFTQPMDRDFYCPCHPWAEGSRRPGRAPLSRQGRSACNPVKGSLNRLANP